MGRSERGPQERGRRHQEPGRPQQAAGKPPERPEAQEKAPTAPDEGATGRAPEKGTGAAPEAPGAVGGTAPAPGRAQATDYEGRHLRKWRVSYAPLPEETRAKIVAAIDEDEAMDAFAQASGILGYGQAPEVVDLGPCYVDEL